MSTTKKRKELRTYSDRREYLIKAVTKRRQKLKKKAVELMGGRCMVCGISRHPCVFDFHHIDPRTKSFGISGSGITRSWEAVYAELQKCIMVCANCHREISLGLHDEEQIALKHSDFWKF